MDLLDMIFGNIAVVIGVIVAVLVLVIVVTGYVKASPDTAYITVSYTHLFVFPISITTNIFVPPNPLKSLKSHKLILL